MGGSLEYLGSFMGKFHPLMIHFPIVLVILIALIEAFSGFLKRKSWYPHRALPLLWIFAMLSSLASAVSGFLLFTHGAYEGGLATSHQWAGFVLCGGILLVGSLYFLVVKGHLRISPRVFTISPLLLMGLTIYTSHLGGSLTHGIDFLRWEAPPSDQIAAEVVAAYEKGEVEAYAHFIQPLLKTHCMSCHNSFKTKGGLNLESWDTMLEGGESGNPILIPGESDSSELFIRVSLPQDHDEFMPPQGKKALPDEGLTLMRWWIEKGGNRHQAMVDSLLPSELRQAMEALMPEVQQSRIKTLASRSERVKNMEKLGVAAQKLHLKVEPDPLADSQLFALSLRFPPAHFDDDDLQQLLPFRSLISKLSLPGSEITDDGLYFIGQMENLRELFIPKTCIKGEGLGYLTDLVHLQTLNVSGTFLSNEYSFRLMEMDSLKQVYLFQTEVSPNIVHAMNAFMKEVNFSLKEGPYY